MDRLGHSTSHPYYLKAGPADWLGHSTSHPYGGMVFFHAGSFFRGNAGKNEWTGIALRIVGVWYGGINR